MGQVKRWRCLGCDEVVLDEHPLNKDMWVRTDNKGNAQQPAGRCYRCGYEYSFFIDDHTQDNEGIFKADRNEVYPPEAPVVGTQGHVPSTLDDARFATIHSDGEDTKEIAPPSRSQAQIEAEAEFARRRELERRAMEGDMEAKTQIAEEDGDILGEEIDAKSAEDARDVAEEMSKRETDTIVRQRDEDVIVKQPREEVVPGEYVRPSAVQDVSGEEEFDLPDSEFEGVLD